MRYSAILRPSYAKACVVAAVVTACQATASFGGVMSLTQAGINDGFAPIQTFASDIGAAGNDIVNGQGAMGITFDPSGRVWVTQFGDGYIYAFPNDTNGQDAQNQPTVLKSGSFGTNGTMGLAELDGHTYMASNSFGNVGELTTPGGVITHTVKFSLPFAKGVVTSNVHDSLYLDIGPGSNTQPAVVQFTGSSLQGGPVVTNSISYDDHSGVRATAMALSPDQNTLYVLWGVDASNPGSVPNVIDAYSLDASGAPTLSGVYDANVGDGIDGMVAGTGKFAGDMFVDTGDGKLFLLDPTASDPDDVFVEIADGGSNGGYMAVDPWDGSLFIAQSDRVVRLMPASDGGFAATAVALAPEPTSLGLLGLGAMGLLSRRRRA